MTTAGEAGNRESGAGRHPGFRPFFLLGLSALAIFLAGTAWLALFPPVPMDLGGAPNLDRRARAVTIPLADDHLDGWWLPGSREVVVVLFHGYGRDHHRAWRYGAFLSRAGYGVVTVDFRSSRSRHRLPTTLGAHELADAEATLAWVRSEPGLRGHRIVLFGESLGGSVALVTAARAGDVAAVIADCPFATGRRVLEDTFNYWLKVPGGPPASLTSLVGRAITGRDPAGLNVLAAAESLRTTPIFLIHAEGDDRMRAAQARDLWRAAGGGGELWLTEGGHNEGWKRSRDEYERRVLAFLDRALGASPHGAPRTGRAAP